MNLNPSNNRSVGALRSLSPLTVAEVALLVIVGGYTYYFGIWAEELLIWDEAIYAAVAETVVERGEILFPHAPPLTKSKASYRPFFDKPPLAFWLQAVAMSVFGVNELAARLPSATASILTGILVYVIGRRRLSRLTGFLGGLIFLATPYLIYGMNGGRDGSTDTLLTLFGTLFVVLVWQALENRDDRLLLWAAVAGGLAVLTKGLAAGIFVIVVAPLVVRHWRYLLAPRSLKAIGVTATITLWWPLLAWYRYGNRFVDHFLAQQLQSRVSNGGPVLEPFASIAMSSAGWYPWALFAIASFVVVVVDAYRGRDRQAGPFLAWWALVVPVFFGFQQSHPWYLIPMYVPGALLAGHLLTRVMDHDPVAITVHLLAAIVALDHGLYINSYHPLPEIGFATLVLGPLGVPYLSRLVHRSGTQTEVTLTRIAGATVVAALLVAAFIGGVSSYGAAGEKRLAQQVNAELDDDEVLYAHSYSSYALNVFAFYVEESVEVRTIDELPDRTVYAVYPRYVLGNLSRSHEVLAVRQGASHELAFVQVESNSSAG